MNKLHGCLPLQLNLLTVSQSNSWQNLLLSFLDWFLLKVCYWYFPAVPCCYFQYFALWLVSKYSGYILLVSRQSSHSFNCPVITSGFWHHPFLQHNIPRTGKMGTTDLLSDSLHDSIFSLPTSITNELFYYVSRKLWPMEINKKDVQMYNVIWLG